MIQYIKLGWPARNWFQDCEHVLRDLFPDPIFAAKLLAATSPRNTLRSNVRLFRRVLFDIENNRSFSGYFPSILPNITRLREGQELSGQKVRAFAAAMMGDSQAVVVDMWLMRAFGYRDDRPTTRQFNSVTKDVREVAPYYGLTPCQLSAVLWYGCRLHFTGQTENHYAALLYKEFRTLFS